ncbi:MAG: SDR family NAD(P)-dependent oxidoreductase [Myxococcales bacterium]|nr:SDR family NAD(P)-dependent oxidoreductase [Myxococcales bacterium]MDH3484619.1 SDR family NAD(P)-dependent oxidoreductase [Myxococcales bacterium]
MGSRSHDNPFSAVLSGLLDQRSKEPRVTPVPPGVQLDGRTCLVTGANSGLGKATAIRLAKRGAHVIMACRSGIPEAGEDVKRESGSNQVEMMHVDLSDFESIDRFCDELRNRNVTLDAAVFNAGVVPVTSRTNKHGLELMFAVNFLAKFVLLDRLLRAGVIPNAVYGNNSRADDPPRVIFVSSETHRSSIPIDFDHFGKPVEYGVSDGVKYYGLSKLHLTTYFQELSRRLNPAEGSSPDVCVHAVCPGAINSNMAREAPAWLKPVLKPVMALFFQSPEKASIPVDYLVVSDEMGRETGAYMHMMRMKESSEASTDPKKGALLWSKTEELLRTHGVL